MALVLHHYSGKPTDKLVLLGIANHDGDGGAWPTVATLARYASTSPRSVQRALSRLADDGVILVERQKGGTAETPDDRRPNRYRVLISCPPSCDGTPQHRTGVTPVTPRDLDGVTARGERGDPTDTPGVTPLSPEPPLEPSSVEPSPDESTGGDNEDLEEAHRLCLLLADLIYDNGSKRPNVTDSWVKEIERMHRIDGRPWDHIERAIKWCQADPFWRANVMSPRKLREKFDTMRLQAERARQAPRGTAAALALAQELAAELVNEPLPLEQAHLDEDGEDDDRY